MSSNQSTSLPTQELPWKTRALIATILLMVGCVLMMWLAHVSNTGPQGPVFINTVNDPTAVFLSKVQGGPLNLAPSAPLSNSLGKYKVLPESQVVVSYIPGGKKNDTSSFAHWNTDIQKCQVHFKMDGHGNGALIRGIKEVARTSVNPNAALRTRLNEYETLHELGHCQHAAMGYAFYSNVLSAGENEVVSKALGLGLRSDISVMYREMFADAYALHRYLSAYSDAGLRNQALQDIQLLKTWREAETQMFLRARTSKKQNPKDWNAMFFGLEKKMHYMPPQMANASHATAPVFAAVLNDVDSFLAQPADIAASHMASKYIVDATNRSWDGNEAAFNAFTSSAILARILENAVSSFQCNESLEVRKKTLAREFNTVATPYQGVLAKEVDGLAQSSQALPCAEFESNASTLSVQMADQMLRKKDFVATLSKSGVNPDVLNAASDAWDKLMTNHIDDAKWWPKAGTQTLRIQLESIRWGSSPDMSKTTVRIP